MAEDNEQIKPEGEIENPKPDISNSNSPPTNAVEVRPPPSPATSFTNFSVNIWPPSQRTRDAVINRLIENISTPSILSKRYGTLPPEESSAIARQIEDEAFSVASASAAAAPPPSETAGDEVGSVEASVDEGIQILHIYSKEISRRMIDSVKAKVNAAYAAAAAAENGGEVADSVTVPAVEEIGSEEVQPLEG